MALTLPSCSPTLKRFHFSSFPTPRLHLSPSKIPHVIQSSETWAAAGCKQNRELRVDAKGAGTPIGQEKESFCLMQSHRSPCLGTDVTAPRDQRSVGLQRCLHPQPSPSSHPSALLSCSQGCAARVGAVAGPLSKISVTDASSSCGCSHCRKLFSTWKSCLPFQC